MKGMAVPEHEIISIGVFDKSEEELHRHANLEIFYILQGSLEFQVNENRFLMEENDFIFVQPGDRHAHHGRSPALFVCLHINGRIAEHFLDIAHLHCEPADSRINSYGNQKFRKQLRRMLGLYLFEEQHSALLLNSAYYQFLYYLQEFFSHDGSKIKAKEGKEAARIKKIQDWMYRHYTEEVQLGDLADYMNLTPPYLSKYFKRVFGSNFLEFLTALRLEEVCGDLANHPDRSILRIAYDNGFTNINSFNKAFKTSFGLKPSEYRAELMKEQPPEKPNDPDTLEALRKYIEENPLTEPVQDVERNRYLVRVDANHFTVGNYHWNKVINVGRAADLLLSEVREQLLSLRDALGITHIRVWDLYSEELSLFHPETGESDFSKLNRILDFLSKNQLHLYLDIGLKPHILLEEIGKLILVEDRDNPFSGPEEFGVYFDRLLEHCIRRYGQKELEAWYFEVWYDQWEELEGSPRTYLTYFNAARNVLKARLPAAKIGGPGDNVSLLLDRLEREKDLSPSDWPQWDFVSVYYFGDDIYHGTRPELAQRMIHRESYFQEWIETVRNRLDRSGYAGVPIHVTEWNFSVSNRNVLNDSVFNAAYLMKNSLDLLGKVELTSYWVASDLFGEYGDIRDTFFGGAGLITRDGLKKPIFHASFFLTYLEPYIVEQGEKYLVTTDGEGAVRIVCHNYVHPGPSYPRFHNDRARIASLFEDGEECAFRFELAGMRNQPYLVKSQYLNQESGNLLAAWTQIKQLGNFSMDDMTYLQACSMPRMEVESVSPEQGLLRWETTLKPNEVRSILLIPGPQI